MIRVLHFVSKMDRAGQETFLMNMYRYIDREEFQFIFLCTDHASGDYDDEILELGGDIRHLPNNRYSRGFKRYLNEARILSRWLKENKECYDITHLHTYHAMDLFIHLIASEKNRRSRFIAHSHNTLGPHKGLHVIFRALANGHTFTRWACSYDAGLWMYGKRMMKQGSVSVIYNGIDPEEYRFSEIKRKQCRYELGIKDEVVVGHVGRFNKQKNHEKIVGIFCEFLKHTPSAKLIFVGKGELEGEIRNMVYQYGIADNVLFLGTRSDIPRLLSAMDLLLFPSLHEGLSVVLVEAQAAGLKCVVSDHVLAKEANIVSQLFSKVPIDNEDRVWSEKMSEALDAETDRPKCCNLMLASEFNIRRTAKQLELKYEQIAGQ